MTIPRLPGPLNRKIGQALHDWRMLSHGDRVLVAVSGGVDSLVAAWILQLWRAKAPIEYDLEVVYIDNSKTTDQPEDENHAELIGLQVERWGLPFSVVTGWPVVEDEPGHCFLCARNRRTQLFDLARRRGCGKVALGHHKDDLIETFFINALYSGNISTMLPRQELFGGKLSLIRILSYLEKKEVRGIAELAGIEPLADRCPLAGDTRRTTIRELLVDVYSRVPGAKGSLFAALGNVRTDYLLSAPPVAMNRHSPGNSAGKKRPLQTPLSDQEQE